jgi:hypothetical protein
MSHPFDDAVHLAWQGGHAFAGHTHPAWANMVGPYGGITAAVAVQALMQHPECLGEPLALTINYPVAVASGPFELRAMPVRTNRSTQHWTLELVQPHQGEPQVMMTATAVTALRRDTWRANDLPMPAVLPPEEAAPIVLFDTVEWVRRYDMRLVQGAIPDVLDDSGQDSLTQLWLRDQPARPLDLPALALPGGFDRAGLPLSIQVLGMTGADEQVLGIGQAWQGATDWHKRRPDLSAFGA